MGKRVLCPRCRERHFTPYGEGPATDEDPYPAMTRTGDTYVCNWCGVHEAFMDLAGIPLPTESEWPIPTEALAIAKERLP